MTDDSPHAPDAPDTPQGMPRWVKTSALVVLALVVVMVIIMLASGGEHGPGRHSLGEAPSFVGLMRATLLT